MKQQTDEGTRKRPKRKPQQSTPNLDRPTPAAITASLFVLFLLKRHVVSSNLPFAACVGAWYLFKKRAEVLSALLVLSASWPPCEFDHPQRAMPLPVLARFLDFFPSFSSAFPGVPHARPMKVDSKRPRLLDAWYVAADAAGQEKGEAPATVLYFKSPFSHRGQYLRTKLYAMLSAFNVITFDRRRYWQSPIQDDLTEEVLLRDAHAIWKSATNQTNVLTREMALWGTSVFGSYSAATLCLYLMRRGTPPACLVLENPLLRMPNSQERFDLEDRIRAICQFEDCRAVPIMFVCSRGEMFAPAAEDCHRLCDVAAALSASQRIILHSLPQSQLEMYTDLGFRQSVESFISRAVRDANSGQGKYRAFSTDFSFEANNTSILSAV
ncbi:hypothetical protein BASA81_015360 [Batrachochytrium salamandrivorans]|nr:hypothetical protein BASA81_015360 [Batrachochytrium salamandrivorans]